VSSTQQGRYPVRGVLGQVTIARKVNSRFVSLVLGSLRARIIGRLTSGTLASSSDDRRRQQMREEAGSRLVEQRNSRNQRSGFVRAVISQRVLIQRDGREGMAMIGWYRWLRLDEGGSVRF